jgi:hypothetical protein
MGVGSERCLASLWGTPKLKKGPTDAYTEQGGLEAIFADALPVYCCFWACGSRNVMKTDQHAHERGTIDQPETRELKVTNDNAVNVLDFGSKALEVDASKCVTGA